MTQLKNQKILHESEKKLLKKIRNIILKIDSSAEVILYGSRARGDADFSSDYDLLVLTDGEASLKKEDIFRQGIYPLELETGLVLTVILISRINWKSPLYEVMPLYQNIMKEGIML